MRIVITGGSGLIGRELAGDLAESGYQVVVPSRSPEGVTGLPAGVQVAAWDTRSAEQLARLVDGADAVVHLAGESIASGRWTAEKKRRIRDSRVESSRALAEALRAASRSPGVLVQGSAVGYYGPRGDEVIDETAGPGDDFLAGVCSDWEEATAGLEAVGVRRPVIRTGVVLSAEGGALPKMLTPFRLFAGGPLGTGQQYLPWIHIADQVGAIRFLLEHGEADGAFNLAAPNPLTNKEFSRILGRVLGRPSILPAPAAALRLALGEMADILLEGQRAVPSRLLELGYEFRFPEAEAALRDLL